MAANLRKPRELAVVADRDDDRLIGRVERLIGNDVGVRIALPRRVLARDQRVRRLVGEHGELRVEQRHVDVGALARLLAPIERGEDRDAGVHAGEKVGDGDSDAHRPAARLAVGKPVMLIRPPMPWMMKS